MSTFWALIRRDVTLGMRASGGAALAAAFFALIVVLVPFGLGPDLSVLKTSAPGLFWIAALLSTLLGLERIIQPDTEDGTMDLIRLSPIPLEMTSLAKITAHWLTSGLIITVLAPALAPLLNLATEAIPILALSLLIGTPALSAIGTAAAALGSSVQRGGMILALLALPLNIPFLIFGATAVSRAQAGDDPAQALLLLGAASLITLIVGSFAAAAALRIGDE
ncbi:MAG: heme exporter protein CcmB [Micropepsaceae bacterium]